MRWARRKGRSFSCGTRAKNQRRFSTTGACLKKYCHDDVVVLRQACRVFRREFMQIGNIEVFLESIMIASACNEILRKRFLQPEAIGLIPTGGYICNNIYSTNTLIWLLHMEETDGVKIMRCRNGRGYSLPGLTHYSLDRYCPETRTFYEFFGCFYHGHTCLPFRDVTTLRSYTIAERYEQIIFVSNRVRCGLVMPSTGEEPCTYVHTIRHARMRPFNYSIS